MRGTTRGREALWSRMKPLLWSTILLLPAAAVADEAPDGASIVVDLADDTTDADEHELEAHIGALDLRLNSVHSGDERFFVADVPEDRIADVLTRLAADPRVESAERNAVYEASFVPDDPLYEKQWSFRMVDAAGAWDHADGDGVVVAVIDTGVAYEDRERFRVVEDLRGARFVKGYNFVSDSEHANDDHGHGTHVAGTIAQVTNNHVGVAGLAHRAKIMPLKVLDRHGRGSTADIADAIRYAADEGAHVINMSLGGGMRSFIMESAVAYALKKGVVVVAAAGNGARGVVEYPAAYKGAIAVSAVGPDAELAYYSSWGKEVALAAPGGDKRKGGDLGAILQNTVVPGRLDSTDQYMAFQGTSMATPHVAGVAALVMSAGVTDPAAVEKILRETATPGGEPGWDPKYGDGIVHAGRAVKAAAERSGGVWHLATALGLLALLGRGLAKGGFRGGPLVVVGLVVASSGLFFLRSLGVEAAAWTRPLPAWDLAVLGVDLHHSALWLSALPIFAAATVLLGVRRLSGLLVGVAIGWAAYLAVDAVLLPADVRLMPGASSLLDRAWLLGNALLTLGLARVFARGVSR